MSRTARRLLLAAGALALVAVVVVGLVQAGEQEGGDAPAATRTTPSLARQEAALAGAPAPLAALHAQPGELLGGGLDRFEQRVRGLRGYPVVVNAWASWCGPCRFELPYFARQNMARGKRVAFLGLNVRDSASDAAEFAEQHPMAYPSYVDREAKIAATFGVGGLPFTVFYDRDGKRTYVHQGGYAKEDALAADIDRYAMP